MKNGRTHLAYKSEHVVDLKTEVNLAAEVYGEAGADKGYHAADRMVRVAVEWKPKNGMHRFGSPGNAALPNVDRKPKCLLRLG